MSRGWSNEVLLRRVVYGTETSHISLDVELALLDVGRAMRQVCGWSTTVVTFDINSRWWLVLPGTKRADTDRRGTPAAQRGPSTAKAPSRRYLRPSLLASDPSLK